MFPAPRTIASSTSCCCTSMISPATESIRSPSSPYSLSPISDSPESFRRTRLKTARAGSETTSSELRVTSAPSGDSVSPRALPGGALTELEALELEHLCSLFVEHVPDGFRSLVDPRLVDEHL